MNDDDSLLSAYIDGELDPASRLEVESDLLTDPRLADEMQELTGVRDLLAGLSRPETPRDLALAVCSRIEARRAPWTSRVSFAPALSAAAALLIAVPLGWLWFAGQGVQKPARTLMAAKGPAPAPESPQEVPNVSEDSEIGAPVVDDTPKGRPSEIGRVAVSDDDPEAKALEDAQAHARKLLDSPNLHQVYIVTDVIGGDAVGRVDTLLQQTPRGEPRYARITVCQKIEIDPRHPDQATVFAVVLDDREMRQLHVQLKDTFPRNLEVSPAEPSVVTQLADIGQVAVLSGISAPDVTIPAAGPSRLAFRTEETERPLERTRATPGGDLGDMASAGSLKSDDSGRRGITARGVEGPRRPHGLSAPPGTPLDEKAGTSLPVATREEPGSPSAIGGSGRDDAESRAGPSVVLVWVTNGERRGADPPSGEPGGSTIQPPGAGG